MQIPFIAGGLMVLALLAVQSEPAVPLPATTADRLEQMRDTVENAKQDSFDEHDKKTGWCSSFARARATLKCISEG